MAYHRDSLRQSSDMFEATVWDAAIRVSCRRCRHAALFEPTGLWWRFFRRDWDFSFGGARRRFFCRRCLGRCGVKVRAGRIEGVNEPPQVFLARPSEAEWRRALKRFRA